MCAAEGRSNVHFMTQTSKIPAWPNITKSVAQNDQQSVFHGKARKYRIDTWQYLQTKVFTYFHKMEHRGILSFIVISVILLALIGVSRFVHQKIVTTPTFVKITTYRTFLRGLLLLFLGPEDLRPMRGTNNSSSLNETMSASNLMAGSFHLHSSHNFDAYLSEVFLNTMQFDKFLSFEVVLVFGI